MEAGATVSDVVLKGGVGSEEGVCLLEQAAPRIWLVTECAN